jgi:Homeodomain-like domain
MTLSAEDGRRFFRLQQEIDLDECRRVQALGCPDCGGPLDRNDHARKPRGLPFQHFASDPRRLNLCCRHCRAHNMPESVVYLGRRVYVGVVVALASILVSGLTPRRLARVQAALGVSAQTVRRWRRWWQAGFVASRVWVERRGSFVPAVDVLDLPNDLVGRFVRRPGSSRLLAFLRFLSPLTITLREGRGSKGKFA